MPEVLKESEKLNPHKRPKEPEKVRKLILQTAEKLASAGGEDSVSFAKIAKMVGISTGAVIHHFPNKNVLLEAVVEIAIDSIEKTYEEKLKQATNKKYLFTKVYVQTALRGSDEFTTLLKLSLTSVDLSARWKERITEILLGADSTDRSEKAELLRFCADGIWLTKISSQSTKHTQRAEALLMEKLDRL